MKVNFNYYKDQETFDDVLEEDLEGTLSLVDNTKRIYLKKDIYAHGSLDEYVNSTTFNTAIGALQSSIYDLSKKAGLGTKDIAILDNSIIYYKLTEINENSNITLGDLESVHLSHSLNFSLERNGESIGLTISELPSYISSLILPSDLSSKFIVHSNVSMKSKVIGEGLEDSLLTLNASSYLTIHGIIFYEPENKVTIYIY